MKNIFILTNDMNGGGAEKVLLTLLRHLPRDRFNIILGLVYRRGVYVENIPEWIEVRYLFDSNCSGAVGSISEDSGGLYQRIAPRDSDVEIAFLEGGATKILSASTNSNALKIAWVHIDLLNYHYTKHLYGNIQHERDCYAKFDRIVCVSKGVEDTFQRLFGSGGALPTSVIHNPVDHLEIRRLSHQYKVQKKRLTICASGRLVEQKGFFRLIEASRKLSENGFDFDMWILGDGEQYDALQQEIAKYGLKDRITLLGFLRNPYPYMAKADIFVCSSFVEGMSIVVGEALILNKSIVATDCCGFKEALQQGKYGRIVENSVQGLYQGLSVAILEQLADGGYKIPDVQRCIPYDLNTCIKSITALLENGPIPTTDN